MSETVFFSEGNVSVSDSRFIVNGQTYAMSGITSVKPSITPANRIAPAVIALVGGALAYHGMWGWGIGLVVIGVAMFFTMKDTHAVTLRTSGGDVQALTSTNHGYIKRVIDALNDAIVHRG